jgi:hypothetical protein
MMLPSAMTTGPSGKRNPVVMISKSIGVFPPAVFDRRLGGDLQRDNRYSREK